MPAIRPYQPKDRENVRRVCCHLKPEEAFEESPYRTAMLATYCDYYIECEPQNCFVAVDGSDEAVGCIWCAEDYRGYKKRFLREYTEKLKALPPAKRASCFGSVYMPIPYARKYPAHLHIDVLEAYQRAGLGSGLMDALTAHLRAKGVPGVMLVVGYHNTKGRNFYEKYGFQRLRGLPYTVVMGLKL